jgi:biofilm PGA synthesis N-glycosyltransferase PgaC
MTPPSLLVVTPVFNEAAHLERTAAAVAAQDRVPDRWVIVDDGSTDGTVDLARRLEAELDFVTFVRAPQQGGPSRDNLALAKEARAFNLGLRTAGWQDFDFVGKLDGDVELPAGWFAALLDRLAADPRLGLAGGRLVEPRPGGWKLLPIPDHHVHGAVKLYRGTCLTVIGGVQERLGWDTIDEVYARMHGYTTHSERDLVARHHRPFASADGRLRGMARHGECAWILHYGAGWVLLRSSKAARERPRVLSGLAYGFGYARAAIRRVPRVPDPEFRRFVRAELRRRMRAAARRPAADAEDRDAAQRSIAVEPNQQGVKL